MTNEDIPATGPGSNTGHGHVWSRPDGMRSRCGGPQLCAQCLSDLTTYAAVLTGENVPVITSTSVADLLTHTAAPVEGINRAITIVINTITVTIAAGTRNVVDVSVRTGDASALETKLTYLELAALETAITTFMRDLGAR